MYGSISWTQRWRLPPHKISIWTKIVVFGYRWPDAMINLSKTILKQIHFYTNYKCLLALWKVLSEMNPKQGWSFGKKYFWVKLWGGGLFGPWGPNIWLPHSMVRGTKIWRHQKAYVHVIIYVGFYINPWHRKYTRTQARGQTLRLREGRKIWPSL